MRARPFQQVVLTLLLAALWLLLYPILYSRSPFLQKHFRTYQFFQRFLTTDSTAQVSDSLTFVADTLVQDTLPQDTMAPEDRLPQDLTISSLIPDLIGDYQGIHTLTPFFQALAGTERQIRIAYYGDSSIEGDLMCMTFRDSLQRRFGGQGVGFVPVMSEIPGFRRSVRHAFSDNWYRNVIGTTNERQLARGISGEYFVAPDTNESADSQHQDSLPTANEQTKSYWVSYRGSRWFAGTRQFQQARFFYGRPARDTTRTTYGRLYVQAPGVQTTHSLRTARLVNAIKVIDTISSKVRLTFDVSPNYPLYGTSLESEAGILVDNFPCRGNAGQAVRGIPRSVLSAFQDLMDYDLIILQYGLNVLNARVKDYSWYERQLVRVIDHFQEAMPGVPILLVGVSDKGSRINGRMQTDPSVPRVTNTQRAAAERKGVAFFSLYEAMGGPGSMVNWVEKARPRLANYDYTHFNFKGGKAASDLLLDFLLGGYESYLRQSANPESEPL